MNPVLTCLTLTVALLLVASCGHEPATPGVTLTWTGVPGAEYCVHLQLKPGAGIEIEGVYTEFIENCADARFLGKSQEFRFEGTCPSRPGVPPLDLEQVEKFEVNSAIDGAWGDPALRNAAVADYVGQDAIHLRFPVIVRWNVVENAAYRLHVRARDGRLFENWAGTREIGNRLYYVFDGHSQALGVDIALADIETFELDAAIGGAWDNAQAVHHAAAVFNPRQNEVFLDFPASPVSGLRSVLAVEALADPALVKMADRFLLLGTDERDTSHIPIYTAPVSAVPDRASFRLAASYSPNDAAAPEYDAHYRYCHLWGPELARWDGTVHLFFSAMRIPRSDPPGPCPPAGDTVTVFWAHGNTDLVFGPPETFGLGIDGLPRHTLHYEPPETSGTPFKMKLDTLPVLGTDEWRVFYTWFGNGNHVASFAIDADAPDIVRHMDPFADLDEGIIEAPAVILRNGQYYLFFSSGWFNSQYALHYIMAPSLKRLTRESGRLERLTRPVHRPREPKRDSPFESSWATPVERKGHYAPFKLLRNAGHCSVVEHEGTWYIAYHIGRFHDGRFVGPRSTYIAQLRFREDGSIFPLSY